jgi:tetratricopeptide (TPR) repeat protein/transcriptional regulator with XRE-family HTH domain
MLLTAGEDPAAALLGGFCRRLQELRVGCGVKQSTLARRLGKSQATVSEILNGKIRLPPSWEDVEAIVTTCTVHSRRTPQTAPATAADITRWREDHELLTRFVDTLRAAGPGEDPVAVLVSGFCRRLQQLRHSCGVRQNTLARRIGKSQAAVSEILNGKIRQPPCWTDVEAIVTACAGNEADAGAVLARWRHEREMLAQFAREWRRAGGRNGSRALAGQRTPVPQQLPADLPAFAGRVAELTELDHLLSANSPGSAVVVSTVSGTAGVGKTTLAVHWAHGVAAQFPDGQLYVNLRGFGPGRQAVDPADAVRGFLGALGVPPQGVPDGLDAQAALYRSLLSGRRMLVLADNARDSAHARPLLPGTPGCLALVTSRSQLRGLVIDGARPIGLGLLTAAESRELLARRIGHRRVAAEPQAVGDIINQCARLPLALAIAAARAASGRHFPLSVLAAELCESHGRLDAFGSDEPESDMPAVFSWSYHALTPAAARLFRLLGLHLGPDISVLAAASLAGMPPQAARPRLAELASAHLITEHVPGRYALHDLLRAYAVGQALDADPCQERQQALRRVLDHYLHTAHTAARLLQPHRDPITLSPPLPGATTGSLADHEQAMNWFTEERAVLLAAADHAAAAELDTHTWQLAWTLWTFLDRQGLWHDQAATQRAAVAAAQRLGDSHAQARAHRALGHAYSQLGRFDDARIEFRHALDCYGRAGDQAGQSHTHNDLAFVWERQGRHADALVHALQALDLSRAAGHQPGQANALNTVGWIQVQLGDYQQAVICCQRALALRQNLGHRQGQADAWDSLGYAQHHLGHHSEAVTCYQQALGLWQDLGARYREAGTLIRLGATHNSAGDLHAARGALQDALAILDDLGHPDAEQARTKLADLADA